MYKLQLFKYKNESLQTNTFFHPAVKPANFVLATLNGDDETFPKMLKKRNAKKKENKDMNPRIHSSLPSMTTSESGPEAKDSYRKTIGEEIYCSMLTSEYSPLLNNPPP